MSLTNNIESKQNLVLKDDLNKILKQTLEIWPQLKAARIFITGGTGFIGCWLLESLRHADICLNLNIHATILTRDPHAFKQKVPHLAEYPGFSFLAGNICDFEMPDGEFTHFIHAATDASAHLNESNPLCMFDTVVQGTHHALDCAVSKSVERFLYLSSGAVYGQQPYEIEHIAEDWGGAPDCTAPRNAYAEGKRAAEMLCAIYGKQFSLNITTARIFALLGPYLPLDIHFAAGNFISNAMQGKPVVVNGNGLPCRSYLYASDLTVWLWHMLVRSAPGKAYNIGSDKSVSIRELAERVSFLLGTGEYTVLGEHDLGWNLGRYVPDTNLIARDLNLHRTVELDDAILKTAIWSGWKGENGS